MTMMILMLMTMLILMMMTLERDRQHGASLIEKIESS